MTLRPLIPETVEMISSVMPSAKYSSLASGLKLAKGRTATLCVSNVGWVVENAGGTKLFDRAGLVGCKGHAHGDSSPQPAVVAFGFVCVGLMVRTRTSDKVPKPGLVL